MLPAFEEQTTLRPLPSIIMGNNPSNKKTRYPSKDQKKIISRQQNAPALREILQIKFHSLEFRYCGPCVFRNWGTIFERKEDSSALKGPRWDFETYASVIWFMKNEGFLKNLIKLSF